MSFASLEFFIFLPVAFGLYYIGKSTRWQNFVLVAASYFFYGWWDYRFCLLMLSSSLFDYFGGLAIATFRNERPRKVALCATLALNLLLLGFFKYFNFFADSLAIAIAAAGFEINTSTLSIILPIGISFYTFQTMSYTLDVYRGVTPSQKNLLDYLAFVSFFPQLVAGPIERARNLLPQFKLVRSFSRHEAENGCRLILWGLFKKMVLADNLAALVDPAFASPDQATGASLFLATVGFAFQIYCDFSAYSDIATGAAALFGIRLMRNFDTPYFSRSVGEFWRRWHISLSTWFRDYLYVPMGGSRLGIGITIRNLLLTFLLSGLWHGAAWKFVLWGALHGFYLSAACWFRGRNWEKHSADNNLGINPKLGWIDLPSILWTFGLVCAGWILFRADSVSDAGFIFRRIASGAFTGLFYSELCGLVVQHSAILGALAFFVGLEWWNRDVRNPMPLPARSAALRWLVYTALFWAVILFGTKQTADFIYFQF